MLRYWLLSSHWLLFYTNKNMTETSITLLSQVLWPVAALGSIGLLANQVRLKKMLDQMVANEPMLFMVHSLRALAWLFILAVLPDASQTEWLNMAFQAGGIVVTVIGAAGMLFPDVDTQILKRTVKHLDWVNAALVVNLLVGVALIMFGYTS